MKRPRITLSLILPGAALLLAGCFQATIVPGPAVDAETAVSVTVDSVPYGFDATLDFGPVNPDVGPATVSADITNQTDEPFTVTDVVLDSAVFGIDAPSLPLSLSAGAAVAIGLTFDPDASGPVAAELLVTVDGADVPFLLHLTGEGNFPPNAEVIVEVSGAGTAGVNGTYVRTDEIQGGYPVYRLSGTAYLIYGFFGNGVEWSIDDDFDTTSRLYSNLSGTPTAPNGKTRDWFAIDGGSPSPDSVGEFASSLGSVSSLIDGDVVSPNYRFVDVDGDLEGGTTFQWYRSDAQYDPYATYTAMAGETGPTYTVGQIDDGYYFTVLVTPVADGGIATGVPVWVGPSPVVSAPPN